MLKKNLNKILIIVAIVFVLVAVLMLFAPAGIVGEGKGQLSYSGANLTFGYTKKTQIGDLQVFKFSFGNFLPYILVLAGIVFAVLALFKKLGNIAPVVAAGAFLVAGILFFCTVAMCSIGDDVGKIWNIAGSLLNPEYNPKDDIALGIGPILAGAFSVVAAIICASSIFFGRKK